jgi:hypothetical protein
VFLDINLASRKVTIKNCTVLLCMRELVDVHYPHAACIRVVQDNLSTHAAGALYQAFPPAEARRILRRLEFHYTPKHASWLNMVEIEIGVLRGQCLDRRIGAIASFMSPPGSSGEGLRHRMEVQYRKLTKLPGLSRRRQSHNL